MNIGEAREQFDQEPEPDIPRIQKYVDAKDKDFSRQEWLEVFILIEQCNSWYGVYRELLEAKENQQ